MLIKTVDQGDPGFDRQTSYTAIVEDIPPGLSSTAMLRAYMQELFPNTVMHCYLTSFVISHITKRLSHLVFFKYPSHRRVS